MKRAIYLWMMFAVIMLASCSKDEIGGTATEALAGEWYVTVTAVDDSGSTVYEDDDLFGLGKFHLLTYNTAENVADQLWVSDLGNFWNFSVVANSDVNALTFSTDGAVANNSYDCNVTIEDGKILTKAATTPSGVASDSIVFYVSFSDDPYPAAYGYAKYKISGHRYTGFTADE